MTGDPEEDLRIAAYLDDAMSAEEKAAFESALAADPLLKTEVERLRANDVLLREALSSDAEESIDEAFLARMGLVDESNGDVVDASGQERLQAANDNLPFWKRPRFGIGTAIAASLALVLTLALQSGSSPSFSEALENTPSGQLASLDDDRSLTPVLSFKAGDGRYCREFTYSASTGSIGGIACRAQTGWIVEAWGGEGVDFPDEGEIALASGSDGADLDKAYERLRAGDPITAVRESALIGSDWTER